MSISADTSLPAHPSHLLSYSRLPPAEAEAAFQRRKAELQRCRKQYSQLVSPHGLTTIRYYKNITESFTCCGPKQTVKAGDYHGRKSEGDRKGSLEQGKNLGENQAEYTAGKGGGSFAVRLVLHKKRKSVEMEGKREAGRSHSKMVDRSGMIAGHTTGKNTSHQTLKSSICPIVATVDLRKAKSSLFKVVLCPRNSETSILRLKQMILKEKSNSSAVLI